MKTIIYLNMRLITTLFLLIGITSFGQDHDTISLKGWLVYQQDYLLAFFPLKDQSKTPTYKNFLTEEKRDGERMNQNYSAPPKLLLAKKLRLPVYHHNFKESRDSFIGNQEFFIQPVKYVYTIKDASSDTTNYEFGAGGWWFPINGKPTEHWAYHFLQRSGDILFLNEKDSLHTQQGGRRKTITIYPPH